MMLWISFQTDADSALAFVVLEVPVSSCSGVTSSGLRVSITSSCHQLCVRLAVHL